MSAPFVGEIRMFAGNFAPRNWAFCNGQLLSIAQNSILFALLTNTYGGNGSTTFALPDLRGRVPMHQGQGRGLTNRVIGTQLGTETVTLSVNQIPAHTHTASATSALATSTSPTNNLLAVRNTNFYSTDTASLVTLPSSTIGNTGGAQPHTNMMPFLGVNFIIALDGIFPSRN